MALVSFTVTAKLICVFVFAYAKCLFFMTRLNYMSGLTIFPIMNKTKESISDYEFCD